MKTRSQTKNITNKMVNTYYEKVFKLGYDKRVIKSLNKDYIETVPYGSQLWRNHKRHNHSSWIYGSAVL